MLTKVRVFFALGVIISFAAVIAIEEIRLQKAEDDYAELNASFLQYQLDAEKAQAVALASAAKETERRLSKQRSIINAKNKTLAKLRNDFNSSNAVSIRLRKQITKLSNQVSNQSTSDPTTAGNGETKAITGKLGKLATLADDAAGKLAKELDGAIARGRACEILYNSLSEGVADD